MQGPIEENISNTEELISSKQAQVSGAANMPADIVLEFVSSIENLQTSLAQYQVDLNNIMQYATMIVKLENPYKGPTEVPINNSHIYTEQYVSVSYQNVYVYFEEHGQGATIELTDRSTRNDSTGNTNWFNYEELVLNDSGSFEQNISSSKVSGVKNLNIDYEAFQNHTYFGLAQDKFVNAYTKIRDIEAYNEIIQTFPTSSDALVTSQSYSDKITEIKNDFTQYERYMYEKSGSYA
jgi:hypothetical protein